MTIRLSYSMINDAFLSCTERLAAALAKLAGDTPR